MKTDKHSFTFLASCVIACLAASSASAQQAATGPANPSDTGPELAEIVVTGTLLRGVAPVGTNVLAVTNEDITATGAVTTNAVLASVPQITSIFNRSPSLSPTNLGLTVNSPNIRNLGAASGTTTLVLVDGHRIVNSASQTSVDPDVIPPIVLERIEVVPDGGSSIYGADAVGGVVNFITRKKFDGFEASGHYGFADNYYSDDVNLLSGKSWDRGSAYLAYSFANNSILLNRDRSYAHQLTAPSGYCNPGTVLLTNGGTTTTYALPGRTAGTQATCDDTANSSIIPARHRNSVFIGFNQEIAPQLEFALRGFWSRLEQQIGRDSNDPGVFQSVDITSANPYYVPIGPNDPGTQTVHFSYAGQLSDRIPSTIDTWGATPTLTFKFGNDWQVAVMGNFGRTVFDKFQPEIDTGAQATAIGGTTTGTALNPYDPGATNPGVLNSIFRLEHFNVQQRLTDGRVVLDGSPLTLPGGKVRLAVGAESSHESYEDSFHGGTFTGSGADQRTVNAAFTELAVPFFGDGNAMPGLQSLILSLSGRFDHYSDFGSTFNPKIGVTFKPLEWFTLRGNWGKSFVAPSLADKKGAADSRFILLGVSPFLDPNDAASNFNRPTFIVAGGNPNLQPQKAKTYSVGFDVTPVVLPDLTVSATYYNIDMNNQIAVVPFFNRQGFLPAYSAYVIKNPTLALAESYAAGLPLDGGTSVAAYFANPANSPYVLIDARRANLGIVDQDGIDFDANYVHDLGFGKLSGKIGGSYTLGRKIAPIAGQAFVNDLETPGGSRLNLMARVGLNVSGFDTSLTLYHTAGYDISPAYGTQTHIDAFNTVDYYLGYSFTGHGLLNDTTLTFNVMNLFNADPPFVNLDPGYQTPAIGRVVQVGLNKKF